jgi:hypothetical protein
MASSLNNFLLSHLSTLPLELLEEEACFLLLDSVSPPALHGADLIKIIVGYY